jgi:hypothetical protein
MSLFKFVLFYFIYTKESNKTKNKFWMHSEIPLVASNRYPSHGRVPWHRLQDGEGEPLEILWEVTWRRNYTRHKYLQEGDIKGRIYELYRGIISHWPCKVSIKLALLQSLVLHWLPLKTGSLTVESANELI